MRRLGMKLALVLVTMLSMVPLAQALEMSKAEQAQMRRFAANNSLFVLYHELGHLLFDKLEMPILGREEDAADNLATWMLLNKRADGGDKALTDAAQGWIWSGIAYDSGGAESDYAAGHTLDKQRAYQIVCLMVGMDETAFRPIATEYRMERDRQDSCFFDYDNVDRALRRLLGARDNRPGAGTHVVVTYHDVSGKLKAAADAFKSSGVFEEVANELRSTYNLHGTVQFNARRCGEANAYYDPETVEVLFCYELMQDYMDLFTANRPDMPKTKNKAPKP
jgi:hypothetical protein